MPDSVNEGFGASAPAILATASVDILCRYIASPPDGFVRIRTIDATVAQISAGVALNTVVPIFVLRGNANLGVSASAGGNLVIPLRPAGGVLPGLPDVGQIGGGLELLLATYVNSRSGRALIFPDDDENHTDLVARDTQKLVVCVGPLVDVSASPPVLVAGATFGASLSVLGSFGKLSKKTQSFGGMGDTKSMPRYDLDTAGISEPSNVGQYP